MKIRMRTTSADSSGTMEAGKVYEVSKYDGKLLCSQGYAERVGGPETAATAPAETAVTKRPPKKSKPTTKKPTTKKRKTKKRKTKKG